MGDKLLTQAQIGQALQEMSKAINETSITNGALVREDLQSQLVIMGPRETRLRNRFNRVTGQGNAHAFYRLKKNADVSKGPFYGTTPGNGVFPKGGLPTDAIESYSYTSVPYANLGDVVQVTFQDQAQGRTFTDLMAQRTEVKMLNAAMIEEYFILWGDSSSVQPGGGFIFDGLIKQIANNGGNIVNSPTVSIGVVRQVQKLQYDAGGNAECVVMDSTAKGILTAQVAQIYLLHQNGGNAAFDGMTGGLSVNAWDFGYGVCDWIVSRYLTADPYTGTHYLLSLDDKSMDGVNDGNVIQMVDVDAMHSVDLAIVATAWRKVIYETTTLMVSAPAFQGMVTGLTYAGQSIATG